MGFIYLKDKVQPEPVGKLIQALLYGVLSCFVVLAAVFMFPDFDEQSVIGAILNAFVMAAIPEECAKFLMFWLLVHNMKEFDEPFDGIVYSACVGLGFAGFENIMYLFDNVEDVLSVGIMRGCFSVPGHFFFAVAMGYYYSQAHFGSRSMRSRNLKLALFVPIMLHGIFDAILMVEEASTLGILMLVWLCFCIVMFRSGLKRIKAMRTPVVPTMGTPLGTPPPVPGPNSGNQMPRL